jgi:hypothetical protein
MRQFMVAAALSVVTIGALLLSAQSAQPGAGESRVGGFSAAASAAELPRERELAAMPSARAAEADFDVMTAEPHHTGSPYEIKLADCGRAGAGRDPRAAARRRHAWRPCQVKE